MAPAREIVYSVITTTESGQSVGVLVDGVVFPLHPSSECPILFTGKAPEAKEGYKYVKTIDGQVEEHEVSMRPMRHEDAPNEFYNRTWNTASIAEFPDVLPHLPVINRIESGLHDHTQIPTIHLAAEQDDVNLMHTNLTSVIKITSKMTYIRLNDVKSFTDVKIKLAGRSSRLQPKPSYNIILPKKSKLFGYRRIKLRSLMTDPSYIREQLSYDFMKSIGLPTSGFSFVRVFLNNQPLGLFGLMENYKNPWLKNEFGGGKRYEQGILYQGMALGNMLKGPVSGAQSDLAYRGPDQALYADGTYQVKQEPNIDSPKDYTKLMELTKFLAEAPTTSPDAVKIWQKWIDTECLIRNMVAEILLGLSDGYIVFVDNYYLYLHPQDNRFIFLASDVDVSLGSTCVKLSDMWSGDYRTFPGMSHTRPLVQKMLEVPQFRERFENLLVELCQKIFNLEAMSQRIDDLANMVREDVQWDKQLLTIKINARRAKSNATADSASEPASMESTSKESSGRNYTNELPPPFDPAVVADLVARVSKGDVSLDDAVNGPTGHISLAGIKEWIDQQSKATLAHFKVSETK
ncbi:hypothetical protein EC973_006295 [Apophysomyces ossiformis]|uniref:Uncharacterized protein n=1 Tax=Apophysomyces ossiformis TaxID=679940 RepID=A0A8H7BVG2_9FUNG|nr:hypothetical protein EC973_006295 [Apophysomyces ossiformis]